MKESQRTEWKESWRDDHLRRVCGFAVVPVPVQIRVYDDKLVLWNPAVLPEGWTQRTLLSTHQSHPQNPGLANAFFRAGEIEAWGRGIERIFAACRDAGTPKPRIRFDAGLRIEFSFSTAYQTSIHGTPEVTPEVAPEVGGRRPESRPESRPGGSPRAPVETPVKTPAQILAALSAGPQLTLAEVAAAIGKSVSAVERAAAKLVKTGKIRFVGPRKGGYWKVIP